MAGILDVSSQRVLGGASVVGVLQVEFGARVTVELAITRAGTALDLDGWRIEAPISLRTAKVAPSGTISDLGAATSSDTFRAVVSNATNGLAQVAVDTSVFPTNPEPGGGPRSSVPAALCAVRISETAAGKSHVARLLVVLRHGAPSPSVAGPVLPDPLPDFFLDWELVPGN